MTSTTRTNVRELFDITLRANNLEELASFYSTIGLRKAVDDADVKVFILGVNELEIHRAVEAADNAVTIQVQVPELEQVEHRLQQAAIDYERPDQADGLSVIVRDPNGNVVSFITARA